MNYKKRFNPSEISDNQLLGEFYDLYRKLGRTPTIEDMKNGSDITKRAYLYRRRFGSIKEVCDRLNIPCNLGGRAVKISKKDLLEGILDLKKVLGKVPTLKDMERFGKHSISAYKRRFGSYTRALDELNLKHSNSVKTSEQKMDSSVNALSGEPKAKISGKCDLVEPKNVLNSISNSIDCYDSDIIIHNGNELKSSYIKSLPVDKKEKIADDLFEYFRKKDFSRFNIHPDKIKKEWENLQIKHAKIKDGKVSTHNALGSNIYKHFFPNIQNIKTRKGRSVSAVLADEKALKQIIRNRLGLGYKETFNITANMIRQGAKSTGLAAHGSQFKPLLAKHIYGLYVKDGDNVLDYSCGFGSRLLGLMATGKKVKYYGFEPNKETYDGLINMANHFGFDVNIKNFGSELGRFKDKMNFVFSSPPYFDHEIYSDDDGQCYNKYQDYVVWLDEYWRKTVVNIRRMLADDAIFGINVGNKSNDKMIKLTEDMVNIIEEEGFELYEKIPVHTPVSHLASKSKGFVKEEFCYFFKLKKGHE